jgi:hypothetical protein
MPAKTKKLANTKAFNKTLTGLGFSKSHTKYNAKYNNLNSQKNAITKKSGIFKKPVKAKGLDTTKKSLNIFKTPVKAKGPDTTKKSLDIFKTPVKANTSDSAKFKTPVNAKGPDNTFKAKKSLDKVLVTTKGLPDSGGKWSQKAHPWEDIGQSSMLFSKKTPHNPHSSTDAYKTLNNEVKSQTDWLKNQNAKLDTLSNEYKNIGYSIDTHNNTLKDLLNESYALNQDTKSYIQLMDEKYAKLFGKSPDYHD